MGENCHISPSDKRNHIAEIGSILIKDYGKKKYYEPEEVKKAHRKSSRYDGGAFYCWDMSVFCSHEAFDAYHKMYDETCDYIEMKKEMLQGIGNTAAIDLSTIPDIDMDASWLDLGDLFDGIVDGIGEFFGSIIENI